MSGKGEAGKKPDKAGLGDPLYQPKDGKAQVDIVFVHGLGGDRINTWTWRDSSSDDKTFWPAELLPTDCPTARIVSFGYNADIAKFYPESSETIAPELTIDDYSRALLEALKLLRGNEDLERPIIFVAHSMGGLVVANALSANHKDAAKKAVADRTIGTLFLGTPFLGSSKAWYAKIATAILDYIIPVQRGNVKDLEVRSKKLTDICQAFAKYLKERDRSRDLPHLEVACFFEERPMSKRQGFVVPRESATWLGTEPLSIQANHVNMAKFETNHGTDYQMVVGKLKDWILDIEKNKAEARGGVGGLNAQAININQGAVSYQNSPNVGGVQTGNIVSTTPEATKIYGSSIGSLYYGSGQPLQQGQQSQAPPPHYAHRH
ncbi:Alpha/Beta hydrolase protein [Achaetomium macrosporum]|uniref:Alpha/Beta hydrolase protein n=1 Tax=Achaetomium macrosporum TaxID=79813 RepID=A0AAN7H3W5_9PEZI|nr:Alpha/Beta hydrolase protein [Achaetomium macrosporum]